MALTDEQRRLIEEKRKEALKIRAEKEKQRLAQQSIGNGFKTGPASKPTTLNHASSSTITKAQANKPFNDQYYKVGSTPTVSATTMTTTITASTSITTSSSPTSSKFPGWLKNGTTGLNGKPMDPKTSFQQPVAQRDAINGSTVNPVVKNAMQQGQKIPSPRKEPYVKPSPPVQAPPTKVAVKFTLKTKERFEMVFSFNAVLIEMIKKVPTAKYDPTSRNWNFDLEHYRTLLEQLIALKKSHNIELELSQGIPEFVLVALLKEKRRENPQIDLSTTLPSKLYTSLYQFQKEGVEFAISRNGRCLIADDMGLGKTIQGLATAYYYRKDWPLLIVCPSSLRFQWKRAIGEWFDDVDEERDVEVVLDGKRNIPVNSIVIISYDLLTRVTADKSKSPFNMIILDESHFIKNDLAQRTKAALKLIKSSKRVLLLTGTPALSRPMELFTQLTAVDSKNFAKKHDFGLRYCDGKLCPWGYNYQGSTNSEELKILLEATVMIRRLKVDVLKELPEKRRTVITMNIDLPKKAKSLMETFKRKIDVDKVGGEEQRSILFQWFATTAELKVPPVCEYLSELVENGRKFICFAYHKVMIDSICRLLEKLQCSYIRIDGGTPSESRQECCDYFQTHEKCKVAVIGITAAGMGITLTAAQLVVFAELYYNPGILTQAEDRAHRIGQQDSVLIQYIVSPGTVDDHIWPLVNKKFTVLNKVGLTKDNFSEANESKKRKDRNVIDQYLTKAKKDEVLDKSEDQPVSEEDFQLTQDDFLLSDDDDFNFDDDDLILDSEGERAISDAV